MTGHSRRRVLAVAGLGLLSGLTGCKTLADRDEQREIDVENYADQPRTLAVRVLDGAGDVLFEREETIPAGEQASHVFRGTPATIRVRADGSAGRTFDWPTPACSDGKPAPAAELEFGKSATGDGVLVRSRCDAPSEKS